MFWRLWQENLLFETMMCHWNPTWIKYKKNSLKTQILWKICRVFVEFTHFHHKNNLSLVFSHQPASERTMQINKQNNTWNSMKTTTNALKVHENIFYNKYFEFWSSLLIFTLTIYLTAASQRTEQKIKDKIHENHHKRIQTAWKHILQ